MKNINKLFETNNGKTVPIKLSGKEAVFEDHAGTFSGETVKRIIFFVNSLHRKYKKINMPITFIFGNVIIIDKLTYIIFECICYDLIKEYNHKVSVYWNPQHNILTDGVFSSPLLVLNGQKRKTAQLYPEKFNMDIYMNHFRRVIKNENIKSTNYLGKLFQDLNSFLKLYDIDKEYRNQIGEVISELVGNACEHGNSDCLLDIDITDNHIKEIKKVVQSGKYYGINIAVLNFSNTLIGDGVKNKILIDNMLLDRYDFVKKAYIYHKEYFSDKYKEEDFYNISAIQDKISGRIEYNNCGGTGLTMLIKALQEKSDTEQCYMISGKRCVMFVSDFLEYDENEWLGFNKSKNFITDIPDERVVTECHINFPGTAYNLNFIMKREE